MILSMMGGSDATSLGASRGCVHPSDAVLYGAAGADATRHSVSGSDAALYSVTGSDIGCPD